MWSQPIRAEASVRGRATMKRDLRGKRILITGASGGIGRSLAERAAARGAALVLAARSADKIHELAATLTAQGASAVAAVAPSPRGQNTRRASSRCAG